MLLLHGFPHTRAIWRDVAPRLAAAGFRAIAPDLHGLGDSTAAVRGYQASAIATDLLRMLDVLGEHEAHVVGTDLGVTPAFALAASSPERVSSLTLSEGLIGLLPGAEAFLRQGPPWWFGFHQAPGGLAEDVLENSAERYIRFFLSAGSRRGLPADLTQVIVEAYRSKTRLSNAFDHYRAMPATTEWIGNRAQDQRLTTPTLAIGGGVVGTVTARQLEPITDRLDQHLLEDCGHITPIDQPDTFADLLIKHARSV
ncbi:alpha/beta hydrolase [Lentzea sp.]|uniref:alpha/beta fold hydrolase n=1 Tax=Lentzea sp. TaxID=56099 RepID=UPI002BE22F4E|nr:alpha/beta hydrolase [Lentzea sp.]HUQ56234.1 alpha/beta hydrolase [Lentzea sp.]